MLCNEPVTSDQCCGKNDPKCDTLCEFKSSVRSLNGDGPPTSANDTEFVVDDAKIERHGIILTIYEAKATLFVVAHGLRRISRANFTNRHAAGT